MRRAVSLAARSVCWSNPHQGGTMDASEFGEKNRAYITEYIKFGDAKAGAIIALVTAVAGALGACAKAALHHVIVSSWMFAILAYAAGAVALVSGVLCLWRSLESLSPRTPRAGESLASFPDVAGLDPAELEKRSTTLDATGIAREYSRVNATLARISAEKFRLISKSVFWLKGLLLSTYLMVVIYAIVTVMEGAKSGG